VKGSLILYQHSPAWGLPSSDPSCIAIQAYLKILGLNYEVVNCDNPHLSPTLSLPVLEVVGTQELFGGTERILQHVQEKLHHTADEHLNRRQKAALHPWIYLLEHKLYNALLYNWWAINENAEEVAKLRHFNTDSFPLKYLLFVVKRRHTLAYLNANRLTDEDALLNDATECYQSLSDLLGENNYFFGDKPSTLDAFVFGHLSVHLVAPMSSHNLSEALHKFPNLQNFCTHFMTTHFGLELPPPAETKASRKKKKDEDAGSSSSSATSIPFAKTGLFAVVIGGFFLTAYYVTKRNAD
jgi:metaxin